WTIPGELRCYLYTAVFSACGILKRRWLFNITATLLIGIGVWDPSALPMVTDNPEFVVPFGFYVAGAGCCLNPGSVLLNPLFGILLLCLSKPISHLCGLHLSTVLPVIYCYITLLFAYRAPVLPTIRWGDFSYGLFLYSFPIQQAVVASHPKWNAYQNTALV